MDLFWHLPRRSGVSRAIKSFFFNFFLFQVSLSNMATLKLDLLKFWRQPLFYCNWIIYCTWHDSNTFHSTDGKFRPYFVQEQLQTCLFLHLPIRNCIFSPICFHPYFFQRFSFRILHSRFAQTWKIIQKVHNCSKMICFHLQFITKGQIANWFSIYQP